MKGLFTVRLANAVVAVAMVVLLAVHGVGNALQLVGIGTPTQVVLGWALLVIACLHVLFGIVLTAETLRAQKSAGVSYPGLNKRFWVARISGLAIAVFVIAHVIQFMQVGDGPVRLAYFGSMQLACQILLVVSVVVHVAANAKPLMISLGVPRPGGRALDLALVVSAIMLIAGIAFVVYFCRWSVI